MNLRITLFHLNTSWVFNGRVEAVMPGSGGGAGRGEAGQYES